MLLRKWCVFDAHHALPASPLALEFQSTMCTAQHTLTMDGFKASPKQLDSPKTSILTYKIMWNTIITLCEVLQIF